MCVIISLDEDVIKTHNMTTFVNFLSQYIGISGDILLCAELLNPFTVAVRYPYVRCYCGQGKYRIAVVCL